MVMEEKKAVGLTAKEIFRMVDEGSSGQRAFFCTFEMLQNYVALEKRHLERSGQESSIAIIRIGKESAAADREGLEQLLLRELRAGDPIAKLEPGAYILMLAGADEERARFVLDRIHRSFHSEGCHSGVCMTWQVMALDVRREQ